MEPVDIRFEDGGPGPSVRCIVEVGKASLHGHPAELRIVRKVTVKDNRPVHASEVVFRAAIGRLTARNVVEVPRDKLLLYSYEGQQIGIEVVSELEIDDGVVFDTTIRQREEMLLGLKPAISNDAKGIVDPKDIFDFITNLKAIPPANQAITIALLAVGAVVIAFNTWVGWHDQWVPDAMTWFYDHRDSDGESESPLEKSLMASGVLGAAIWYAVKMQLRKYMTFEVFGVPERIAIATEIAVSKLVRGRSRVDLRDVIVRIVSCNMEMGQYKRGSGTKERTVSFKHPVRAVVLYEKRLELIPARAPVENHLDGVIRFDPMFRALYPPQVVGSSHGLSVHWEVQLIHDDLVDQEVICRDDCFVWEDFRQG